MVRDLEEFIEEKIRHILLSALALEYPVRGNGLMTIHQMDPAPWPPPMHSLRSNSYLWRKVAVRDAFHSHRYSRLFVSGRRPHLPLNNRHFESSQKALTYTNISEYERAYYPVLRIFSPYYKLLPDWSLTSIIIRHLIGETISEIGTHQNANSNGSHSTDKILI